MGTVVFEYPSTLVTSPTGQFAVPAPLRRYSPKVARAAEIKSLEHLPELTVVWTVAIDALLSQRSFLRTLSERLEHTPEPAKIVFFVQTKNRKTSEHVRERELVELFTYFTRPFDLEIAQGAQAGEDTVRVAVAKIVATRSLVAQRAEQTDHLSRLRRVIQATEDLRVKSGKLSANNVASVFGVPVAELATLIGRTRQALSKTPDADSLQVLLHPFERVARLRTVLRKDDFRRWLHLANDDLDGHTPIEMIRRGRVAVIAELVEDMLTGSPS